MGNISWRYYIVYCVWLAVELVVVYFFYIEPKNTPLEEIAKHIDGEDALVGGQAATEKGRKLADGLGLEGTMRHRDVKQTEVDVVEKETNTPQGSH